MFLGVGTDIVSVRRVADLVTRRNGAAVARWFSRAEADYCFAKAHSAQHLAARLAAKEAVFKALRVSGERSVPWREIEVGHDDIGAPVVVLTGELAHIAEQAGVGDILLTLAHTDEHATATAIAVGR